MNIIYFFTFGYSLFTWKKSGQLNRELEHFKYWRKINPNLNLTIITYGDEKDLNLINSDFITVIPIYKYVKFSKFKIINLIKSFLIIFTLKKIIHEQDFDVVIQNQLLGSWISYQFKKYIKTPLIIRTGYDMYEFSINEKKSISKIKFYRFLTKLSLNFSDLYTVTSKCDKTFLIKQFGKSYSPKIKVRKNWVSLDNENKLKPLNDRYNNKIACVGRIEDQKNYTTIVNALKDLNFTIDIFGEGSKKNQILKLANKQNVDVNFKGTVDNIELKKLLKSYKYYLTASKFEGNPKSVLEAMAAGCLVIASDIKNHTEFLNNENSKLFSNKKSLNKIIMNLEKNDLDHIKLIENALNTIKENYDLENIAHLEINDIKKFASAT
jgi:glycosyltransferase involved in cell wall biosynthesis